MANKERQVTPAHMLKIKGFKQLQAAAKAVEEGRKREDLGQNQGGGDEPEDAPRPTAVVTSSRWSTPRKEPESQQPKKRGASGGARV
eukprot:8172697-Pyramimonas_sp.AAC.1